MWQGIVSAICLKLTSSVDDVLWLTPFFTYMVTRTTKLQNAAVYIGVCVMQALVASLLASSGDWLVSTLTKSLRGAWSSQRILTVGAGTLLALYSVKLAKEDCKKSGGEEESAAADRTQNLTETGQDAEAGDASAAREIGGKVEVAPETGRSRSLFVIAFLGSVDDLTLFVPMLVGKGMGPVEVVIGSSFAALVIVLLCVCVGRCEPVAKCLNAVPLFCIVGAFAALLLVKGLCFTS